MVTRGERQKEAFEQLKEVLTDTEVEYILVEGARDVGALRFLGVTIPIDVFSHVGMTEHGIAEEVAAKAETVLVLTDFDEKGIALTKRISELLTAEGVRVQWELRRKIRRLVGILGVKTIEALDNWVEKDSD